jgi:hypothetical protein
MITRTPLSGLGPNFPLIRPRVDKRINKVLHLEAYSLHLHCATRVTRLCYIPRSQNYQFL